MVAFRDYYNRSQIHFVLLELQQSRRRLFIFDDIVGDIDVKLYLKIDII